MSSPSVTITPSDFIVTAGSSRTIGVFVSGSAPTGPQTFVFTGTGPGLPGPRQVNVTVNVAPNGTFDVDVVPLAITVAAGGAAGSAVVSISPMGNFSGSVSIAVQSSPGITVTPSAFVLTHPETRTVSVSAAASFPAGSTPVIFLGVGGSAVTGSGSLNVTVTSTAVPDFTLAVQPGSVTAQAGGTATVSVSATGVNGYTSPIDVTLSPPAGITATPATFTLIPGGVPQSVQVLVDANATSGTRLVGISGTGGGLTRTTSLAVDISPRPDFTVSIAPSAVTLTGGGLANLLVSVAALGGFASTVDVVLTPPAGVTATPAAFSILPGAQQSVQLRADATAVVGTFPLTATATSSGLTRSATASVTVLPTPDFTLSVTPQTINAAPGGTALVTVSAVGLNGFTTPLDVRLTPGAGVTATPATFTLMPGSSQAVELRVGTATGPGPVTVGIAASGGGLTRSASVTVTVASAPDFSLAIGPPNPAVVAGQSVDLTLLATPLFGFQGTVSVTATSLPAGATLSPSPTLLTPGVSTVGRLTTSRSTPPGTYSVSFQATGGGLVKTAAISLRILPASSAFTVTVSPPVVPAAPSQAVSVVYTFRNTGATDLLVTSSRLTRSVAGGETFDQTEERISLRIPARGAATLPSTVLATAAQFSRAGRPAIVICERTFSASSDASGFVPQASAQVALTAANSLVAPVSITRVAVVHPIAGTLVGRDDVVRAQGLLMGSGTGTVVVGWLYDGVLLETIQVHLQNGTATAVSSASPIPTLLSGRHEISLTVLSPASLSSPAVPFVVAEGAASLRLVAPAAGSAYLPGLAPPTFAWVPAPGLASYRVGLKRAGAPEAQRRWFEATGNRFGPSARDWADLAEGEYEWVVRGFTGVSRELLAEAAGGVSLPSTSELVGFTATSSVGRFAIGRFDGPWPSLGGTSKLEGGVRRFEWTSAGPEARYLLLVYPQTTGKPDASLTAEIRRDLPEARAPKGARWRAVALDGAGRVLGATALKSVDGGAK